MDINSFWKMYPSGNFRAHPVYDGTITQSAVLTDDPSAFILTDDAGANILVSNPVVIGVLWRFC